MALMERIEVLRRIDSLIDFNRATAQLKILVTLDNKELSIDELVKETGLKRKTILDAVRKLELKGVVARKGHKLALSELGSSVYKTLRDIALGKNIYTEDVRSVPYRVTSIKTSFYETYDQLLHVIYMLKVIKILGDSGNKPIYIKNLANKVGVSPTTLMDHLIVFTNGDIKLFNKIYDITTKRTYFALTELGLKLYNSIYRRKRGISRKSLLITILAAVIAITLTVLILLVLL